MGGKRTLPLIAFAADRDDSRCTNKGAFFLQRRADVIDLWGMFATPANRRCPRQWFNFRASAVENR